MSESKKNDIGPIVKAVGGAKKQPLAPVSRAGVSCPTPPPRKDHARLQLKSVTFSGGHDIDNDTYGNFKPPHFLFGRSEIIVWGRVQFPAQFPYAITRGKKLSAVAVFTVTQKPTGPEKVTIDAEATVAQGYTLKFNGIVDVGKVAEVEIELTSDLRLPNTILKVDPLTINWFQTPCDVGRRAAGSSANTLYITLKDPKPAPPAPLYWTLLEVSCAAASGKTTVEDLRTFSYAPLRTRKIKRTRDGHDLTYWNPRTTKAYNTRSLLAANNGSGQCGSWAEFLVDMWKAHGDEGGHKVVIARNIAEWGAETLDTLFLVKNWSFVEPKHRPNSSPFYYRYGVHCTKGKPAPGQNSLNPWPEFVNHFIVFADGLYYDPSYGSKTFSKMLDWEFASIDGLHLGDYCGYQKSLLPKTQLLEFYDLVDDILLVDKIPP